MKSCENRYGPRVFCCGLVLIPYAVECTVHVMYPAVSRPAGAARRLSPVVYFLLPLPALFLNTLTAGAASSFPPSFIQLKSSTVSS